MSPDFWIALALIGAGLVGCVVPILPGPPLAWLGALYFSFKTGWVAPSPLVLGLLLVVTIIGATADWWMSLLGARKGGASVWSQLAALVGGLIGFLVLSLPGLFIGALGAIALVEFRRHQDWNQVFRAGSGYLVGYLLSMVVEVICVVIIAAVFFLTAWPLASVAIR